MVGRERVRSLALQKLVRRKGGNAKRLATVLGMKHTTVAAKLNGQNPLDAESGAHEAFLEAVLREIGATRAEFDEALRGETEASAPAPRDLPATLSAPFSIEDGEPMVELPYAGLVPAGEFDVELAEAGPISVPARFGRKNRHLRFACRVLGPSCAPLILQGDVVIFERDLAPPSGTFVVAQRKGDHFATLKLLEIDPRGEPFLHAMNPDSPDPADGAGWGVIAKLVGVWRDRGFQEIVWHENAGLTRRHFEN